MTPLGGKGLVPKSLLSQLQADMAVFRPPHHVSLVEVKNLVGQTSALQRLQEMVRPASTLGGIGVTQLTVPRIGGLRSAVEIGRAYKDVVRSALENHSVEQLRAWVERINTDPAKYERLVGAVVGPALGATLVQQLQELHGDAEKLPEVQETARAAASDALEADTVEGVYARFNAFLKGLDPTKQLLLYFLLAPLLVSLVSSVINPVGDHFIKKWLTDSPQGLQKEAEKTVVAAVGGTRVLADYRLVVAKSLDVKASPAALGRSVGRLYFGSAVRVIRTQDAFTFVEWGHEDGAVVSGWVYSRYLKRFN
jgi:hypothetical protein